jgi:hypothetical protein
MDVARFGIFELALHRIWLIARLGCSIFEHFLVESPSNLVEAEDGCMIYAKQTFRTPSDSAQAEDGWMICASHLCQPVTATIKGAKHHKTT